MSGLCIFPQLSIFCLLFYIHKFVWLGIPHAANKVLGALNRMRAGTTAEKRRMLSPKGQVKRSLTTLFKKDGKRSKHQIAWKHTFVCLAYRDQNRIPTTELEKDGLYEAG